MSNTLLLCPFCGKEPITIPPTLTLRQLGTDPLKVHGQFYSEIRCSCGAAMQGPNHDMDCKLVIETWNRRRNPAPVAVSERLPKASSKVLAYYVNELGMGRTICAIWVPAKSRSDDADLDDDDFLEYDEQTDEYYWPEGWYEAIENWDDLGYIKVNEGEIIYWQPLPDWHATVLPMPAGEGK